MCAAAFIEINAAFFPFPALGVVSVCPELRGCGGQVCLADDTVKGSLTDDLAERIGIEGYLLPGQRRIRFPHPEGIVQ